MGNIGRLVIFALTFYCRQNIPKYTALESKKMLTCNNIMYDAIVFSIAALVQVCALQNETSRHIHRSMDSVLSLYFVWL